MGCYPRIIRNRKAVTTKKIRVGREQQIRCRKPNKAVIVVQAAKDLRLDCLALAGDINNSITKQWQVYATVFYFYCRGYDYATVPFLAEVFKLIVLSVFLWREFKKSPPPKMTTDWKSMMGNWKIVTTAILFRLFLSRKLSNLQWMAIILLAVGTATSQVKGCGEASCDSLFSAPIQGYMLGILSACLSAFAGVYAEFLMKKNNDSLYWQNVQLYTFGAIFNMARLLLDDFRGGFEKGPLWQRLFDGYSVTIWMVVLILGSTGLGFLVNEISRQYSQGIFDIDGHVILTMVLSMFLFNFIKPILQVGMLFWKVVPGVEGRLCCKQSDCPPCSNGSGARFGHLLVERRACPSCFFNSSKIGLIFAFLPQPLRLAEWDTNNRAGFFMSRSGTETVSGWWNYHWSTTNLIVLFLTSAGWQGNDRVSNSKVRIGTAKRDRQQRVQKKGCGGDPSINMLMKCDIMQPIEVSCPRRTGFHAADVYCWQDGAIVANNPSIFTIREAQLLWPDTKIDCLVSIGCGSFTYKGLWFILHAISSFCLLSLGIQSNPAINEYDGQSMLMNWPPSVSSDLHEYFFYCRKEKVVSVMLIQGKC
ncbi:Nucleotide-sugar transporter [Corchorus olitorius]|uniref:Nucleotide-sugar transporter n=1 Tax=Corchorus olitorius TaxID=93759 RepID=A0A1R3KNE1_9ROSI|nr:Nucleotide-sugar transporter [Corchorus olitorius]